MPVVVGLISNCSNKAFVTWSVKDHITRINCGDYFESPECYFLGESWTLRMFPDGDSQSVGWISLYLAMLGSSTCSVTYTLSFKDDENPVKRGPITSHTFDKNNKSYGWTRIVLRKEIVKTHKYGYNLPICLIISCEAADASFLSDAACQSSSFLSDAACQSSSFLSDAACQTSFSSYSIFDRDFRDLLSSGRKSDVSIEVQGSEFKAHKWILEASSPVFDAMFATDMREKNEGIVEISDCDPDTFQNFLLCVYSGRVENLSVDNVIKLYKIAHKYSVDGLKEKCAEIMEMELSVDVVCEVLDLAYKHSETRLLNYAKEFLFRNIKTVLPTDKWRWFMTENGTFASTIVTNHVLRS